LLIVRRALRTDAKALATLAETTFRDAFGRLNSPDDMDLHCRTHYGESIQAGEIADTGLTNLLIENDGRLVGFAQLRWGEAPASVEAGSPGEIQRLYVASAWHGKGAAQQLMNACLEEMRHHGSDVVWLGVWERNPRAISFYRKFAFVEVGAHAFRLGRDLQRDILMARPVSRPHPSVGDA
jgi:ribosomal protein S18 acetylase RimI-like enzyme